MFIIFMSKFLVTRCYLICSGSAVTLKYHCPTSCLSILSVFLLGPSQMMISFAYCNTFPLFSAE